MEKIITAIHTYKETITLILIGSSGAVAHIAYEALKGNHTSLRFTTYQLIVSGFVGYLTCLTLTHFGIETNLKGAIIGLTTFAGVKIMDIYSMIKSEDVYSFIINKTIGKK